jgi:hypothetical protein
VFKELNVAREDTKEVGEVRRGAGGGGAGAGAGGGGGGGLGLGLGAGLRPQRSLDLKRLKKPLESDRC